MRRMQIALFSVWLLCVGGMALAAPQLELQISAGFDGYYRERTLVPIAVLVRNHGADLRGEFRVTAKQTRTIQDRYRFPAHIPKGANKLLFRFHVIPERFTSELTVEFWSEGRKIVSADVRGKQLVPTDRLVVVVGGGGSSLNYLNGQQITVPEYPLPTSWNVAGYGDIEELKAMHGSTLPTTTGNVRLAYVDAALLPANPEAYGSVSMLALMSDVTENTLPVAAQEAIPLWVVNGGHLLIAGGGVSTRLEAPFFRGLLPGESGPASHVETLVNADGDTALTAPLGAGRVSALRYDPGASRLRDWQKISAFYGGLAARERRMSLTVQLASKWNEAVMVRNLRPPDFKLIVAFLALYLIVLVPVNYFVLKKMDMRELAWVTTPVIVLVFTVGAYGIGYLSKGHRLVLNVATLVETAAGHTSAEALSQALIFSPSRTGYLMNLGEGALLAREVDMRNYEYGYYEEPERHSAPLSFRATGDTLVVENVRVDMWDFRQFVTAHRLTLGSGFTANLRAGAAGATPRATGVLTNGTPYAFPLCELYADGALVAGFAMSPGETVTVERAKAITTPAFSDDERFILDKLRPEITRQFTSGQPLSRGLILVGYTSAADTPIELNNNKPSAALTVMVVHL